MSKLLNAIYRNPLIQGLPRSKFDLSHNMKTTMEAGKMIPLDIMEVLPGDTFQVDLSSVIRSVTPFTDTMDNAYLDIYAFFVPHRLSYFPSVGASDTAHHWEHINGQNDNGVWARTSEATALCVNPYGTSTGQGSQQCIVGSVANHLGIPTIVPATMLFNAAPFNALGLIWNYFFRDENVDNPITINTQGFYQSCFAGNPFYVNKFHDYFTSCLPSPQKGDSVAVGLTDIVDVDFNNTFVPMITGSSCNDVGSYPIKLTSQSAVSSSYNSVLNVGGSASGHNTQLMTQTSSVSSGTDSQVVSATNLGINPQKINASVDLTNATAITINQLRYAFATQRLLESDARGGTRYIEILQSHYNQFIKDEVIQYPEFLGGKRVPLTTYQVPGTATTGSGDNTSELGEIGAFGHTQDRSNICIKSFKEHGYFIVVGCVRSSNSYYTGVPKLFFKKRRYDTYYPEFANIGEQAVKKAELYASTSGTQDSVFGYQEAWSEYRYPINRLTGYFDLGSGDHFLKSDSYAQELSAIPTLNEDFIKFDRNAILKTWLSSETPYDYYCDFWFDVKATRPLPVYSIPGLNRL